MEFTPERLAKAIKGRSYSGGGLNVNQIEEFVSKHGSLNFLKVKKRKDWNELLEKTVQELEAKKQKITESQSIENFLHFPLEYKGDPREKEPYVPINEKIVQAIQILPRVLIDLIASYLDNDIFLIGVKRNYWSAMKSPQDVFQRVNFLDRFEVDKNKEYLDIVNSRTDQKSFFDHSIIKKGIFPAADIKYSFEEILIRFLTRFNRITVGSYLYKCDIRNLIIKAIQQNKPLFFVHYLTVYDFLSKQIKNEEQRARTINLFMMTVMLLLKEYKRTELLKLFKIEKLPETRDFLFKFPNNTNFVANQIETQIETQK